MMGHRFFVAAPGPDGITGVVCVFCDRVGWLDADGVGTGSAFSEKCEIVQDPKEKEKRNVRRL